MKYIEDSILEKSLSYQDFRAFVSNALANDIDSLGLKSDYINYAKLNEARLHRLDKTLKVEESTVHVLSQLRKKYVWVVITESWCGDAAQIVPMLNKMAQISDNIELRLVFRDQNLELMDAFLTNGGRAIPKLLIANKENNEIVGHWGPRPKDAQQVVIDYKEAHGTFDSEGSVALQLWYTKNKGKLIETEVLALQQQLDK